MSLALVPGSFDPMTLGHLALIREAASRFDRLVVAVMVNPDKQTCFTPEERTEIARRTVASLPQVEVLFDSGMLIDLYDRLHADAVVKGYRNAEDLVYEQRMAEWNRAHNDRFRTVLIRSDPAMIGISSTEVRRRLNAGLEFSQLVHPNALPLILQKRRTGGRA